MLLKKILFLNFQNDILRWLWFHLQYIKSLEVEIPFSQKEKVGQTEKSMSFFFFFLIGQRTGFLGEKITSKSGETGESREPQQRFAFLKQKPL